MTYAEYFSRISFVLAKTRATAIAAKVLHEAVRLAKAAARMRGPITAVTATRHYLDGALAALHARR